MNEQQIAHLAREALDESIEHLPWRVTHRLASGREAALARMSKRPEPVPARAAAEHPVLVSAIAGHAPRPTGGNEPDGRRRFAAGIAAVLVPILIVAAGLFGISEWNDWQRADDIADLEAAVLADDVPVSAYADRGFGVYLRNVSEGERQ